MRMGRNCFYSSGGGRRLPGRTDWEGMEPAKPGDTIGLLLELETLAHHVRGSCGFAATTISVGSVMIETAAASVTAYKNGVRLGVLWSDNVCQGFSWAVSLGFHDDCVAVESLPAPDTAPAPTPTPAPAPAPDWSSDSD